MGVDYYNCDNCNEIFTTCDDHGHCRGCRSTWCQDCLYSVKTFRYGNTFRCTLCFNSEPVEISDSDLLDFALEKLKTDRETLRVELKRARPDEFDKADEEYTCQNRKKHICPPNCQTLSDDDDDPEESDPDIRRGLCCASKEADLCEPCSVYHVRKSIIALWQMYKRGKFRIGGKYMMKALAMEIWAARYDGV